MSYFNSIVNLQRRYKIIVMMLSDFLLLPLAFYSSVALRIGSFDYVEFQEFWWLGICVPFMMIPIFIRIGLYRAVIRYMDFKLLWTIFYGCTIGVLLLTAVITMTRIVTFPRSSIGIFWIFAVAYLGATRLLARGILKNAETRIHKIKRVAIYGAGRAGMQIAYALTTSREYSPVLFFDDAPESQRSSVLGLRIYSPSKMLRMIEKYNIDEILLAMPSVARSRQKEIIESLEKIGVKLKILPGVADVVSGKVRIEDIREVQIEDLLGRDEVTPREDLLQACILGKVVCVTGAGGSIGSELCRQIVRLNPRKIVFVEQNELALYEIEREILSLSPRCTVVATLLNINDEQKLQTLFKEHKIQTIYHAAAYKHVPIVELNPAVGIINNAIGTLSLANASIEMNVEHFILISTDKAVRPTNVMGASKRMAEMILQSMAEKKPKTIFSMVRFGNVLGSSGSVVPLFREQIKKGGPITVTHREITRYFMTIPEAAQLVIQAGAMALGGDVFVLDMGKPIKIYDLAKRMIELSGFDLKDQENPNGDIEIEFTGLRPGEKLYEELLIGDNVLETNHPRIMKANEKFIPWHELQNHLSDIKSKCMTGEKVEIKLSLSKAVKEFTPQID